MNVEIANDSGGGELRNSQRKLSLATIAVMLSTGLSRVLGFVRAAVMSFFFGGEGAVDVYNLVFIIPNNLRNLLAEGALSSAFIPVLSHSLVNDPSKQSAQKLISNLLSFQMLLLIPIIVLCIIFADPIVGTILPFKGPHHELAVNLFSWIIIYLLLVSISAILMAILNSHNLFAVPALAPLMFSITTIVSIFMFSGQLDIFSLVVGVLAGGILQILIMLPAYLKIGYKVRVSFQFTKNSDFRQVLKLWGPVVGTAAIFALNEQIAVYFASTLGPGSGTALTNALLFWQLPFGIFSASITTVLFPRMARHMALQEHDELKNTVLYGLKMLIYLLIPSAIVLMLLGKEIIALALQRGKFLPVHTELAANVLWAYSLGLLTVGASRFLQRFFYANQNFKTPLFSAIFIVALDIVLSIVFIRIGLGVSGLAYANSVSSFLGFLWLFFSVRRKLYGLKIRDLSISLAKAVAGCIPMAVGLVVLLRISGEWWKSGSTWHGFIMLMACGVWAIVSVLGMYRLMRIEAIDFVLRRKRGGL